MVVPLICYAFLHPEQDLVIALVTQSPRLFEYYVPLVADCEWNEATLLSSVQFSLCHYLGIIVVFLPQVVRKVNALYCIFSLQLHNFKRHLAELIGDTDESVAAEEEIIVSRVKILARDYRDLKGVSANFFFLMQLLYTVNDL